MYSFSLVIIAAVFGLVLCDDHFNTSQVPNSLSEDFHDFAENAKKMIDDGSKRLSEDVVDMGTKVKDAMEDLLEKEFNLDFDAQDNTTEFEGIDASGCDRGLLKKMETKCDNVYDQVNLETQLIEDEPEKTEAVCCALEDFERCSLKAYDDANCSKDKTAIRKNLEAARLFLSVVANITCTAFRGVIGCYGCILKNMKTMCKKVYDQEYDAAQLIEDEGKKKQLVYRADVKFGYCTLQAYDNTNCVKDKSDVNDCNINLFLNMTTQCERIYRHTTRITVIQLFEDEIEKSNLFCCALKDMEKCTLQAHDDSNCPKGQEFLPLLKNVCNGLKDNVQFISDVAEHYCTRFTPFGNQCLINVTSASEYAIDGNGCNISLFQNMKTVCKKAYDQIYNTAKWIEDEREKTKLVCCALEDFEKCNLQAYDDSNCAKDIEGVKEYVSQVRWMLSAVAHVSCTNFRRKCLFITTALPEHVATGCKIGHFQNMRTDCFKAFNQVGSSLHLIEDEHERRKVACCGFLNYDKCILRAYDDAHCEKSEEFITSQSNFQLACTEFGSQCLITAAAANYGNAIDTNGCNIDLLRNMETKCNNAFDYVSGVAHLIEDKQEKAKAVCCALEELEKCSLRAYANANCKKGKASTKENLKEGGLFLCVVANVTCT